MKLLRTILLATAIMTAKLACQPKRACMYPPTIGMPMGEMPMIMLMIANCREACAPSWLSRTMARVRMMGPAPPSACAARLGRD